VQGFQNVFNSGDWAKLLKQSENQFPNSQYWLDLQRYIDLAMTNLGEDYQSAQQAVREEVGALVRRLPEIVELPYPN
jgi:hypothetical protein